MQNTGKKKDGQKISIPGNSEFLIYANQLTAIRMKDNTDKWRGAWNILL